MPVVGLGGLWVAMDQRVQRGDWKITTNAPAAKPVPLAGPVFSLQRQPSVLAYETTDRQLGGAVKPVTDNVGSVPADASCFAASLDGRPIVADGADVPVMPASNMKIIIAAVALEVLGPDFTFVTRVNGQINGDTLEGNLFLVGGGDPLLANRGYAPVRKYRTVEYPTTLEDLADQVAARVRRVTGGIVGDESHFDAERFAPGWSAEVQGSEAGPLSGLLLNDAHQMPDVRAVVDEPALAATREFARLLRDRGVVIDGDAALGTALPELAEIGRVASVPIGQVVAEMLTNSDNNTAEMVLKQIGATTTGGQGTRQAGIDTVLATLSGWGVPTAGLVIQDGSGLDRGNRLSCTAILAVLNHVGPTGPLFDGLPVSGADVGTLAEEQNSGVLAGTGTDGRIHAKTGSLTGAKALSGFFDLSDGRKVAFSMLINDVDAAARGRVLWAAMAIGLKDLAASVSPTAIALPGA